jgi:hypothetical protein
MFKPAAVASFCLCATLAQAQSPTLSGPQITDLVAGATVEIDTPVGTKLPVRYGRDGRLSGEAGDLASYLGAAVDRGRWWVAADRLCHKWNRWFNSEPQCLRLSREGRRIRWHTADGYSGTAIVSIPPMIQAGIAALPRPEPDRARETAPPPPAPEAVPETQPAEPAAAQPSPQAAKETAAPPPSAAAPPPQEEAPAAPAASPPPQQPTAPASQPTFKVVNVRSDDVLNVRSGPSADFNIVGELRPGTGGVAIVNACRSHWCPVRLGATSGWVNGAYLMPEEPPSPLAYRDAPEAARACLTVAARALLDRIERRFGPVRVVSTCRPGATIPGALRLSRHASGNAVDFHAGSRKAAIVAWLIANHRNGGTMTYPGMDHIHVDIGPHFVSIAADPR